MPCSSTRCPSRRPYVLFPVTADLPLMGSRSCCANSPSGLRETPPSPPPSHFFHPLPLDTAFCGVSRWRLKTGKTGSSALPHSTSVPFSNRASDAAAAASVLHAGHGGGILDTPPARENARCNETLRSEQLPGTGQASASGAAAGAWHKTQKTNKRGQKQVPCLAVAHAHRQTLPHARR